jgi:hypothetical protein
MQLTLFPIHKKFLSAIKWNSIEVITYNVIFLIHQIALYQTLGYSLFGTIGSFFSVIYLAIGICNFGFDTSLAHSIGYIQLDKRAARKFLVLCAIPHLMLYVTAPLAIYALLYYYNSLSYIFSKIPMQSTQFITLGILMYLSEGLKKSLKCFLDLAFKNKPIAILEITNITLYIGVIWFSYYCGLPLTMHLLIIPLVIISISNTAALLYCLITWYHYLPDVSQEQLPLPSFTLWSYHRFFNWANYLLHTFFSGNFLVPLFAFKFGLYYAGLFKIINYSSHCITSIVHHIFGSPALAYFSHSNTLTLEAKREFFNWINKRMYYLLYAIIIFFLVNHSKLASLSLLDAAHARAFYLFFIINISESFFIIYEKFYISEKSTDYLFAFNAISVLLSYIALVYIQELSPLLHTFLGIRCVSFIVLYWFSFHKWKLLPRIDIKISYIVLCIVLSFFFYYFL